MVRLACLLASLISAFSTQAAAIFFNGFEGYATGANIGGQVVGSGTWTVSGVLAGDQAAISTTSPANGSAKCLIISDSSTNAPRATVNLISSGYLTGSLTRGSFIFYVREDSADGSTADQFKVSASHLTLTRDSTNRIFFNNDQGGSSKTLNLTGSNFTYTPGSWNRFEIAFDNATRQADLYINDGYAATISGTTQDYSVSSFTLGSYAAAATGDKIYYDDVQVTGPYMNDFESYTAGSNIHLLPSNTGTGTFIMSGLTGTDQAFVSSPYSFGGGSKSMRLADNGSNLPSAYLNFINIGLISAPAPQGVISFAAMEDPDDAGADDGYFVSMGSTGTTGLTLTRDVTKQNFSLSMAGSPYTIQFPYVTENYTYTPGQWSTFEIRFNDTAKTADLYINGGYATSQMVPVGGTSSAFDFAVAQQRFSSSRSGAASTGDLMYYDKLSVDFSRASVPVSWRSTLYPTGWTPGFADAQGRQLQDFSYAGYHSGTIPVPNVTGNIYNVVSIFGADPTGLNDATGALQSAIDYAAANGGGVVYLPSGTYSVAPSGTNAYALRITGNNIVLRGDGPTHTFIYNSNEVMKNKKVIQVSGTGTMDWYTGSTAVAMTADASMGDSSISVGSTATFNVGDLVVIRNDLTQAFIDEIGNTGLSGWTTPGPNFPNRMLAFCRRIVSKTTTTLTFDVPLRYGVKATDNGRVFKVKAPMIQEVGLEQFSIGMKETAGTLGENDWNVPGTGGYNADHATAVSFLGAENCWMKQVQSYKPAGNSTYHLLSSGIGIDKSRFITVDSCDFRLSEYKGANGNGYLFTASGQELLFQDCHAESGRHNLSIDNMYSCGNVFLRMSLKDSQNDSDFHQFLSMSNLLDGTVLDGEMLESRLRTEVSNPTPGWTSTESVFWNTTGLRYAGHDTQNSINNKGLRIISSYQHGHGYIIGTQGAAYAVSTSNFTEGIGKGAQLLPVSLYLDQRLKRLGF